MTIPTYTETLDPSVSAGGRIGMPDAAAAPDPTTSWRRRVDGLTKRATARPRLVSAALDATALLFAGLTVAQAGPAEFLIHVIFVVLVLHAFLFGPAGTLWRIGITSIAIAAYAIAPRLGAPFAELELTEWPLMFVIAVLVAWMADRRAATARTYEALFRRASDRLLTVQEDERIRLARDLHDGVGQTMTALGLILDALPSANGLQTTDERLATARDLARDALEETRTLANRLRPARLEHVGLAAAVRTLGDRAGVPVQIRIAEGCAALDLLDPTRTVEAYRIVQEAIGNAARHSSASVIEVAIDRTPALVRIVVVDNGVGFDPAVGHHGGLGIMGMRERAHLLRATFELDSAPGSGTRVILGVPVSTIAGLTS